MNGTIIGLIISAVIAALVFAVIVEENKWKEFLKSNNCKKVGVVSPSTSFGVGFGTNGGVSFVPITNPGKTGYVCDDGVTYWK